MSHNLKAKNKKTGEIVDFWLIDGKYSFEPELQNGSILLHKDTFNELYEVLDNAPVEEWENDLEVRFEHWDMPITSIKQFIKDTLQKRDERLVREICKEEHEHLFCNCFANGDGSDSREKVIKLIQNK